MKYNLTQELPLAELQGHNQHGTYKRTGDSELTKDQKALLFEASQTLDADLSPFSDVSATKYIFSKSYRPYDLFQYDWSYLKFGGLVGANDTFNAVNVDTKDVYCSDTLKTDIISGISQLTIHGDASANSKITSISTTSITGQYISSTLGIIDTLRGDISCTYNNTFFNEISAEGTAHLVAARAKWADMAELYYGDDYYEPGTLVQFGGVNELTLATDYANGCVSEKPAVLMNSAIRKYINSVPLLLTGKTKVKVNGQIEKFDRIELSDIPGIARKHTDKQILGIALESNENAETKLVECIIGLTI